MGADGGICWIRVKDTKAFEELTSWFSWRVLNSSAQAYKSPYARRVPDPPPSVEGWTWIRGAYGTDCDFELQDLVDLVRWSTDTESEYFDYTARLGNEDVRDYTFAELEEALRTDPDYDVWGSPGRARLDQWWSALGPIFEVLQHHLHTKVPRPHDGYLSAYDLGHVPEHLQDVTLRTWGKRMVEVIDLKSYTGEETWT